MVHCGRYLSKVELITTALSLFQDRVVYKFTKKRTTVSFITLRRTMCNNTELSQRWNPLTLVHFPSSLEQTKIVEPVF